EWSQQASPAKTCGRHHRRRSIVGSPKLALKLQHDRPHRIRRWPSNREDELGRGVHRYQRTCVRLRQAASAFPHNSESILELCRKWRALSLATIRNHAPAPKKRPVAATHVLVQILRPGFGYPPG